ncbi:hypothetical protein [Agathobaculum sp.]|uniref:hypothetical protein n=1 Tax=Agathobaculum sp. TaxID=2048138 RepID=UPI002A82433B|nr:hypothetical protein [Agathobaculum sp.]MDY3617753.1 hypothetical protein [Agathobaculum sp.]
MNKKTRYPSKSYLNLAMRERTANSPSRILPLAIVCAVLIGLFAKFAVVDRLVAVAAAQGKVAELRQQIDALSQDTAGYDELLTEYARYTAGWMTDEERSIPNRLVIFSLLEQDVLPTANLRGFSVTDNQVVFDLNRLSLKDASAIETRLRAREEVSAVTVTAASSILDYGAVSMTVTLNRPEGATPPAAEEGGGQVEGGEAS